MPLDATGITDFDDIDFHHGWRKFRNSMPLDLPWMTDFDDIQFHQGWRKFWIPCP